MSKPKSRLQRLIRCTEADEADRRHLVNDRDANDVWYRRTEADVGENGHAIADSNRRHDAQDGDRRHEAQEVDRRRWTLLDDEANHHHEAQDGDRRHEAHDGDFVRWKRLLDKEVDRRREAQVGEESNNLWFRRAEADRLRLRLIDEEATRRYLAPRTDSGANGQIQQRALTAVSGNEHWARVEDPTSLLAGAMLLAAGIALVAVKRARAKSRERVDQADGYTLFVPS